MDRKTDRRLAKTDAAILDALMDLLTQKPLAKVTVTELAKAADIDRKTFYLHYETVDDAFDAIARRIIANGARGLDEALRSAEASESPLALFTTYFRQIGHLFDDERFFEFQRIDSVPIQTVYKHFGPALQAALERSGVLDRIPQDKRKYCVSFLLYLTNSTYNTWLETGRKESLDELTQIASAFATEGFFGVAQVG